MPILGISPKKPDSIWGDPAHSPVFDAQEIPDESGEPKSRFGIVAILLLLCVLAGGVFWYLFLQKKVVAPPVSIEYVRKTDKIYAGKPFTAIISISNTSNAPLTAARLSLLLPEGLQFAGDGNGERFMDREVGDIGPGSLVEQSYLLMATGDAATIRHIQAKLTYASESIKNTQFEKEADIALTIDEPIIKFSLIAPSSVYNGQPVEVKVSYANTLAEDLKGVKVRLTLPLVFRTASSTLSQNSKDANEWTVDIAANSSGTFSLFGSFVGQEGASYDVAGAVATSYGTRYFDVMTLTTPVSIHAAPLALSLAVNGLAEYVAHAGEMLGYTIKYKNNSNVSIKNATIHARLGALEGSAGGGTSSSSQSISRVVNSLFDYASVSSQGSFSSVDNTISWRASDASGLSLISPGEEGVVEFRVRLKDSFPISRMTDKNFGVQVDAVIESPTVPENTVADRTTSQGSIVSKVSGSMNFRAFGLWRDAASKVVNDGPYPPRVNLPTQYSIHWVLSTVASDMGNIHISAFLQNGTRFVKLVKSTAPTAPAYNEHTGEITWDVPALPANTGVITAPYEAVFQVENTPAVNQLGREYELVGKARLTARDQFGGGNISQEEDSISTSLRDDPVATSGGRGVMP